MKKNRLTARIQTAGSGHSDEVFRLEVTLLIKEVAYFMNKTHRVAIILVLTAAALIITADAIRAETTDPSVQVSGLPNLLTIYPNEILSSTFIGFGVQWEYEGDKRNLNIDNSVWRSHWPEIVKRIDFMQPSVFRVSRGN